MLEKYEDGTRDYYNALKALTPEALTLEWQEISQEKADYLLGCLPPRLWKGNAFLVGEAMTHTAHGAIYEAVCTVKGKNYARPAYYQRFNPYIYTSQILSQFHPIEKE